VPSRSWFSSAAGVPSPKRSAPRAPGAATPPSANGYGRDGRGDPSSQPDLQPASCNRFRCTWRRVHQALSVQHPRSCKTNGGSQGPRSRAPSAARLHVMAHTPGVLHRRPCRWGVCSSNSPATRWARSVPKGQALAPHTTAGLDVHHAAPAGTSGPRTCDCPDKDEVGGSTPPRPTTGGDQRKRWSTYPELVRRGVYVIKTSYLITGPRHRPRRRAAIPTRAVCGRTPLLPAGRPALGVGGHAPLGPAPRQGAGGVWS